jgi:ferrous iron transport protein A
VVVSELRGGRGFASRLADMGILPGTILEILQSQSRGQIVIGFRGGRVAVGRGMAEKVMVRLME